MEALQLKLYADADFAGDKKDFRSTSGICLYLEGNNTMFPLAAQSKKQGCVSHSTPEAEIVSANTAIRTMGLPALDLWDAILNGKAKLLAHHKPSLQFLEDNEAAIRILRSGRNPTMRHISRTHGVQLAW